jgi:hypothetical protein
MSRIGTERQAALIAVPAATGREIVPISCQDHLEIILRSFEIIQLLYEICDAFALKQEPGFQSSLLW